MPHERVREIVDVVIDLLAEEQRQPFDEVYEELAARGAELPVDSVKVVEILIRVEERYGVKIDANAEAGRSLRSVWAFAETIHVAVIKKEGLS
ncbi:acyl carrier protein [Embleya hyalina]|nr:acyl carrier protein [Embleya hyalina]